MTLDDDTLLSVPRLCALLGYLDPGGTRPLVVGHRYGFGHHRNRGGYDYITLGGGMAISRAALEAIVGLDCPCASPDAPDDMWLGSCLRRTGVVLVHHDGFHQEQPAAYPRAVLQRVPAISFHRHAPADPIEVYERYLSVR